MKIVSLTLFGFRRLDLLGIDKLVYTPESPYQLILGVNGVGKSSLLNELSPLPCESSDLKENGYKTIVLEHRNSNYTLHYQLNKKLDCSFIKDGIELNNGNTIKIQRDLILEHFNYDTNIHNLLIGFTLLSNMSGPQRREWFVKMNKSDISYAIGIYNKLKSEERDVKGAIKLNQQRLVSEQVKLPKQEEIDKIKQETKSIRDELNHLLPFSEQNLIDYSRDLENLKEQLTTLSHRIIDTKYLVEFKGLSDINDLRNYLELKQQQMTRLDTDYQRSVKELAELQDVYNKNKDLSKVPIEVLDKQIQDLQQEIKTLDEQYNRYNIDIDGVVNESVYRTILTIIKELNPILASLPENNIVESGKRKYCNEHHDILMTKIENNHRREVEYGNRIKFIEQEIKHSQEVHDVNCPNCNHQFKPGIDCKHIDALEIQLKEYNEELLVIQDQKKVLLEGLQSFNQWISGLKQIRQYQERYPESISLFKYIHKTDLLYETQVNRISLFKTFCNAFDLLIRKNGLTYKLNELDAERIRALAANGSDIEFLVNKMIQLEDHLKELQLNITINHDEITQINKVITSKDLLINDRETILRLIDEIKQKTINQIRYENNIRLSEIISERQRQLAVKETMMNSLVQSETVISQLEKADIDLKEQQHLLNILTTILSPQDGLIAESLLGFLNLFLEQMSNVLDQIWVYQMRPYIALDEDELDLDYKIQVDIDGLEVPVSDVSRLSRGQKEIMDFVFKLILMQHLGLQDYPLFMDEVGGSFDAIHRDRLYRYIKLLIESNQVQQVFIISHIASSHDAFSTADRVVLDADATIIDKEVNKVITFS